MKYEFLHQFDRRMKNIGLHTLITINTQSKAIWKQFGFDSLDEQLVVVYTILLFIMEQSLKEAVCTIDDLASFLDDVNSLYFKHALNYESCYELCDFIVNVVLSNEGRMMYFHGYNFDKGEETQIHISYIQNKAVQTRQDTRRTSYFLSDQGYSLLLGTLEIENNLRITIEEMIFKMHLEKQSYFEALDDIKHIFDDMRRQVQKIQEAMLSIRRNIFDYSVEDYERLQKEDMETLNATREKFEGYRLHVQNEVATLEKAQLDLDHLNESDENRLNTLAEIEKYLSRVIDEHQRIYNTHFDMKTIYASEIAKLREAQIVHRFSLRSELFNPLLKNPEALKNLHTFYGVLLNKPLSKTFSPAKILEEQIKRNNEGDSDYVENLMFDEDAYRKELERKAKEKLAKYEQCLSTILNSAAKTNRIRLSQIPNTNHQLVVEIDIFKEIMVELLKNRLINIDALRNERSNMIIEETYDFHLNKMLLELIEENNSYKDISTIEVVRIFDAPPVIYQNCLDEKGTLRTIRCSDVMIYIQRR